MAATPVARLALSASAFVLALAAALAAPPPAAADPACVNPDGTPVDPPADPDQGAEGGTDNATCHSSASAFGFANNASRVFSSAMGNLNEASGINSSALGTANTASGDFSSALGYNASTGAGAAGALSVGGWADLDGDGINAPDERAAATGFGSVAVGAAVTASGQFSSVFGVNARATAEGATAIGYGAVGDREYALSVGAAGGERNIVHVADALQDTDAVNLRQLNAAVAGAGGDADVLGGGVAAWLGGGAAYAGGVFTAPVFTVQGVDHASVSSAFAGVDARLTGLQADIAAIVPGTPNGVAYDDASQGTITLDGADGTRLSNVADAVAGDDAVNLSQMQAADDEVIQTAQAYADAGDARTLDAAMAYTDQRFDALDSRLNAFEASVDDRFGAMDRRMDRLGAMSAAQLNMAINAAGALPGRGRLAVGLGFQNGEEALSVGYGRRLANRVSLSVGGSFGGGGERSAGVGVGFDLF